MAPRKEIGNRDGATGRREKDRVGEKRKRGGADRISCSGKKRKKNVHEGNTKRGENTDGNARGRWVDGKKKIKSSRKRNVAKKGDGL